jgi:hypothetical protein
MGKIVDPVINRLYILFCVIIIPLLTGVFEDLQLWMCQNYKPLAGSNPVLSDMKLTF